MGFFESTGPALYAFIFFGKIIEVTAATVRIVLINRGERLKGAVLAGFEVLLWIIVAGTVLNNFQSDPIKVVVYVLAFALGNYLGSWAEDKLAFGLCTVQIIVPEDSEGDNLANELRSGGFGVTAISGKGKDGDRELLMLHIKRKRISEVMDIAGRLMNKAVIVVNDVKTVRGAFIRK